MLDATPNPALIFDQAEKIVAMNDLARQMIGDDCLTLADCGVSEHVLQDIRQFFGSDAVQEIFVEPDHLFAGKKMNSCLMVREIPAVADVERPGGSGRAEKSFLLTIVNLGFDPSTTSLFRQAYGLTPAEASVAVHLANGMQLPEIAAERDSTIATLRSQIKSIKKKTNARDVPAIVRLLCGFSAGMLTSSQLARTSGTVAEEARPPRSSAEMILSDGRKMSYLEQGSPDGIPVIMLHNMPYGVELPQNAIAAASRMNLRIIAPYRPGCGNSDNLKNIDAEQLLDHVAADIQELLDQLDISKAVIAGQTVGAIFALRFARLYPRSVSSLFAISRAPIWREEWAAQMPKRQRFILGLARHMPQLLPLIMRATVAFIDKGHAKTLIQSLCQNSAADMQALKNAEILELMARGCEEGLKQGVEAFCQDCLLAIMDFSEEAKLLETPFHILHGDLDQIVHISQSECFVANVPGTTLEIVEGAGQLLIYSHWDSVFRAIKRSHKNSN
ncbi:alpha/beta fold hydrolase [Sphingorhabdus sp. YGSMI21]|uniref:alpha/beta fold hydrolase n=1 Tax=Sphingorhabdus sp. YGSMI21 TaxID=2077182 RepID=UPI0013DA1B48|nr:alpha/beta fold hydrolase [Sphingorhabdus sp. YGSMI21]